jgi:hypothetical protein
MLPQLLQPLLLLLAFLLRSERPQPQQLVLPLAIQQPQPPVSLQRGPGLLQRSHGLPA